ncbi:1,3-beta-galactosyl-N-acetylhexosamine phosphorylase N-terminal domain-containing protein [Bacillus cereus]
MGYGGYLSLAYQFPEFISYIEKVTEEFRNSRHD